MLFVVTTTDNQVGFYVARDLTKKAGFDAATHNFGADKVVKIETPPASYNLIEGEKPEALNEKK